MARLTNQTPRELVIEACASKTGIVDITDLSPEKIRELPDVIEAIITFDGAELTLYATSIKKLNAHEATKISLPHLKTSTEIWAGEAEISAPELENGGKTIVAKHLNDTKKCDQIGTLILTADEINLHGVRSIVYADFSNASAIFLHDTETIGSEIKAPKAAHIAAPSLETLTGFFNTRNLKMITLNQDLIDNMGPSTASHISPNAEIRACEPEYRAAIPS